MQITQDLNKIKKIRTLFCRHWWAGDVCEFSAKNVELRVVGARRSFQIYWQKAWFPENNSALSKFLYEILHYLISIIKL